MKKILALILATLMVMGLLAACGSNDGTPYTTTAPIGTTAPSSDPTDPPTDPTTPSSDPITEPSTDPVEGELLDAPEEEFVDSDTYYFELESTEDPDEKASAGVYLDDEIWVFYLWDTTDGYMLYEMNQESEEIIKYVASPEGDDFEMVTDMDQDELLEECQENYNTLLYIILPYSYAFEDAQYKKVDNEKRDTGKAYKYEVYMDEEYIADMWIDEDTGLCVELTAIEAEESILVVEIDDKDAHLPEYK